MGARSSRVMGAAAGSGGNAILRWGRARSPVGGNGTAAWIRWGHHAVVGKGAVSGGREWRGCRIGGDAMLRWEALQGHGEASWWTPTLCTYVVVEICFLSFICKTLPLLFF
jgi:hypothetical protein